MAEPPEGELLGLPLPPPPAAFPEEALELPELLTETLGRLLPLGEEEPEASLLLLPEEAPDTEPEALKEPEVQAEAEGDAVAAPAAAGEAVPLPPVAL